MDASLPPSLPPFPLPLARLLISLLAKKYGGKTEVYFELHSIITKPADKRHHSESEPLHAGCVNYQQSRD